MPKKSICSSTETKAAALAGGVTFAAGAALIWGGLGSRIVMALSTRVDPEVVLLFVPLSALVFAICFEAVRIALFRGIPSVPESSWTPTHVVR